jgi:long-chain acyl-CoA synthetase
LRFTVLGRAGDAVPDGTIALEEIAHRSADYARLPTDALPGASLEPEDIAAIFYTSGTTGRPKGAMGTHRNILTNIFTTGYGAARNCLRRGEPLAAAISRVRLITVPLFHVTGCVSLISGMPAGNTSIFMRRWDPLEAMRIIERERVNITGGVPTIAWELLEHHERGEYDLSSLESIAYGGAPAPAELVRRIHDELGAMPGTGWGMTETMSTVSVLSAEDYLDRPHSCGPAVPVANLKIMDLNGTSEIPVDELGELWAKGPMVVQGYWNQPEASAAVFVDGWVRTGDIARLDEDGFCTIVDRAKDMIIRGGENIFCPEVEAIIDDHPAVREAALIGISHRTLGEEPAAIVHLEPGMCASEAEIQAWVRDRLAVFKVPVRVVFSVDPLPRNAGGKVMKAELRARFEQR